MFSIPKPRDPVASPRLTRPSWLAAPPRPNGVLWLDKNENQDPALNLFMQRLLEKVAPSALSSYPESGALYRKLGEYLGISPECLILTPGSDGAIRATFEAFVGEGDRVVHTNPTFAMYPVYSLMYGADVTTVDYMPSDSGPRLSASTVIDRVKAVHPKLLCLPNPDSPTGTVFPPPELEQIIEVAGHEGTVVLVDEAYHPFYRNTALPWISKYPHLIVARTFAKAWGLAGLRIGYAAAAPDTVKFLHKVRSMYEVSTFSVAFMEHALEHADQMEASVGRLEDGKNQFLASMRRMGHRVTGQNHGNFLHVAFGDRGPAIFAALEGKVLFRRGSEEPCLAGFSRFSATTRTLFESIDRIIGGFERA
jgi:histidinol-phosphate aminotransferase